MNWKKRYDNKLEGTNIDVISMDEVSSIDFASMYPRFVEMLNEMGTNHTVILPRDARMTLNSTHGTRAIWTIE